MESLKDVFKKEFPRIANTNNKSFGENGWDVKLVDERMVSYQIDTKETSLLEAAFGEIKDSYTPEKRQKDIEESKDIKYVDMDRDGFIWLYLTEYQALQCFVSGLFEVYWLHDDGTESLVDEVSMISEAYECSENCALEVGYVDPEIAMRM